MTTIDPKQHERTPHIGKDKPLPADATMPLYPTGNVSQRSESDGHERQFDTDPPCGSLELGQQRQQDSEDAEYPAQARDADKHLTPRAATKEFSFPKSN